MAKVLLKKPSVNKNVRIEDGFILIKDAIYIPSQLKREIFQQCYETRMAEHQRNEGTLERIKRSYYFPHIRKYVVDNIKKCDMCQRNKTIRHALYEKMMSNQTPRGA